MTQATDPRPLCSCPLLTVSWEDCQIGPKCTCLSSESLWIHLLPVAQNYFSSSSSYRNPFFFFFFWFGDMKNFLSEVCTEEIRLKNFPGNWFAYHFIRPSDHLFLKKITKLWSENSTIKFPKESNSPPYSAPSELLPSGNHSQQFLACLSRTLLYKYMSQTLSTDFSFA